MSIVPTMMVMMLALALLSVIVAKRKIESTVTIVITVEKRPIEQIFTHYTYPPPSIVRPHYLYANFTVKQFQG